MEHFRPTMVDDQRWVQRMEDDQQAARKEMREGLAGLAGQIRTMADQFTTLQLSLPPVYVTRVDLRERLEIVTDECDRRDESNKDATKRLEGTIQKLIFVVVGSLITASLGLLNEVFHLLGHTP